MSKRNEVKFFQVSVDKVGVPSVDLYYSEDIHLGTIKVSDPSFLSDFLKMLQKSKEITWDDDGGLVSFGLEKSGAGNTD